MPPGLAFDPLHFTKTTQQATSYELSTDKTGNYLCPAVAYVNKAGKTEVCMNERTGEFRC